MEGEGRGALRWEGLREARRGGGARDGQGQGDGPRCAERGMLQLHLWRAEGHR